MHGLAGSDHRVDLRRVKILAISRHITAALNDLPNDFGYASAWLGFRPGQAGAKLAALTQVGIDFVGSRHISLRAPLSAHGPKSGPQFRGRLRAWESS
jgi:hypothetical protein